MKVSFTLLCASTVAASAIPETALKIAARAFPDSPSGGYAPATVDCPSDRPTIRAASSGLSSEESDWLKLRKPKTEAAFIEFVQRANISGFDAASYLAQDNAQPRIATAVSGGGYRALMYGAGVLKAADNRTAGTLDNGGIGGLLQSTTYLTGLSGGSWLVGSLYMNNFTAVGDMQNNENVWQFQNSIFKGPPNNDKEILGSSHLGYFSQLESQVDDKRDADFEVSLTDYWGRALAYQLIAAPNGGAAYTFSSIANSTEFTQADVPMPIIVSVGREQGTVVISLNSTVFEFSPLEFGSWDESPSAFAPIRYLGTNFTNGSIPDNESCVRGFDSASFVMGTSSSLFNAVLGQNMTSSLGLSSVEQDLLDKVLDELDTDQDDIAPYKPNPFFNFQESTNKLSNTTELALVDGGMDGQNLPLWPLLQSSRAVDVIYALDASADTQYNWPNGTALRATYKRCTDGVGAKIPFPSIPDDNTFVNKKLNQQPTFFGCDASNFSSDAVPPLVVYIPNAPLTHFSNVSTFATSYELQLRDDIILNAYNVGTQGNFSSSLNQTSWGTCLACAALSRSFTRTRTTVPQDCQNCFKKHCWDGSVDTTPANYTPSILLTESSASSSSSSSSSSSGSATSVNAAMNGLILVGSVGMATLLNMF
ncbi:Lysophospholipase [Ceratocystis platani]|uniref:Lysophospholipase n=1 Tax=Ceratocystis fimbriata f. sp. platani TaxID=88771 RepID=A0A0F8B4E5_CERFI|nr:Lysophospholipase [Ceratocystis platani]